MEVPLPMPRLRQIFGHPLGKKDVSGIGTIHYALCHVNSSSGNVCLIIDIFNCVDWAAMNTHAQLEPRVIFYRFANLERASHRRFRAPKENQGHSIASGNRDQFARCLRGAELVGAPYNLIQLLQDFALFVNQQL
jgi:hypothetical protein